MCKCEWCTLGSRKKCVFTVCLLFIAHYGEPRKQLGIFLISSRWTEIDKPETPRSDSARSKSRYKHAKKWLIPFEFAILNTSTVSTLHKMNTVNDNYLAMRFSHFKQFTLSMSNWICVLRFYLLLFLPSFSVKFAKFHLNTQIFSIFFVLISLIAWYLQTREIVLKILKWLASTLFNRALFLHNTKGKGK